MSNKILVADQSPTVRNVTESLLKKHGHEVVLADDGAKALEAAKANQPALIFLDDSMPLLTGEQVLSEIRQNKGLESVPVVILMSEDDSAKRQRLEQMGTDGFIAKPFSPSAILEHVERLLSPQKESSTGEEEYKEVEAPSEELGGSDKVECQKLTLSEEGEKSEDALDIVQTSDFMEGLDPSAPPSDVESAHGFEWFMDELKKETRQAKKKPPQTKKKPSSSEDEISPPGEKYQEESKVHVSEEDGKGFEEFVKDLKWDMKDAGEGRIPRVERSVIEDMSPSQFDHLLSDLKQNISQRVAAEVAKKISLEFLAEVIREEMANLKRDSS